MRVRLLLAALLVAALPVPARAHGEHGAAKAAGAAATVTVQGYEVELLSDPAPLVAGRESRVVAKVTTTAAATPVTGGVVAIGLAAAGAPAALQPAREVTWAGNYVAALTPARAGEHHVRVALTELDGRRFEPPLAVDFRVDVTAAQGLGGVWVTFALLAAVAGVVAYAGRARARQDAEGPLNLLAIPWLRRTLTSPAFQPALQIPLLALTAAVVFLGLADVQDGGRNLATKLMWTIWWAGIIFTFVLAGRVWCLACPVGALDEWAARASGAWRRMPRVFRNLWWATALFVLLTWADELLDVVRSPRVTAWLIIAVAALAILVGLRYQRRSFCRHLCPIGGLIGIYSMVAPVELRAHDISTCRRHDDKECYRGGAAGRGCPMFEFPQSMDRNNYCTFCAECVKGCSRDNLVLRLREFGRDLWASRRHVLDEAYLAAALVGLTLLVTAQMLTAWPRWMESLSLALPSVVRSGVKPVTYLTALESAVLLGGSLLAAPALLLVGAAVANRLAGEHGLGVRRTFVTFAYMFVPVGLAMHLAHNLAHLLLEGGAVVPVVQRAVAVWTPLSIGQPDWSTAATAGTSTVAVLQFVVVAAAFVLSLVSGQRLAFTNYSDAGAASRAFIPFAALSLAFTAAAVLLLQQPMGARHGL